MENHPLEKETGDDEETLEDISSQELLRLSLKAPMAKIKCKKKNTVRFGDFKCKVCKKTFRDRTGVRLHEQIHNSTLEFECPKCPYKAKIKKYITRHLRKVHEKPTKHKCDVCGKLFHYACGLRNHKRIHTGEKPYKCNVCEKAFSSLFTLKGHSLIHQDAKPYKCSFCDYACRDNSTLQKHQNRHMGIETSYQCKMCDKSYKRKYILKLHVAEVHLNVAFKRHKCENCGKDFKSLASLKTHVKRVHAKSLACECDICGLILSSRYNMKTHLMVHGSRRPYKCDYKGCDKTFKDISTLRKHNIIHYPSLHIPCKVCGRTFARKNRLKAHLAQHKPKRRSFKCQECGVGFYSAGKLSYHKKRVHLSETPTYYCDLCTFKTTNKASLVMHLKRSHRNKCTECHICNVKFKKHEYYKLHNTRIHHIQYKRLGSLKKKLPVIIKVERVEDVEVADGAELLAFIKQEKEAETVQDVVDDDTIQYSDAVYSEDVAKTLIEKNRDRLSRVPEDVFDRFVEHVHRTYLKDRVMKPKYDKRTYKGNSKNSHKVVDVFANGDDDKTYNYDEGNPTRKDGVTSKRRKHIKEYINDANEQNQRSKDTKLNRKCRRSKTDIHMCEEKQITEDNVESIVEITKNRHDLNSYTKKQRNEYMLPNEEVEQNGNTINLNGENEISEGNVESMKLNKIKKDRVESNGRKEKKSGDYVRIDGEQQNADGAKSNGRKRSKGDDINPNGTRQIRDDESNEESQKREDSIESHGDKREDEVDPEREKQESENNRYGLRKRRNINTVKSISEDDIKSKRTKPRKGDDIKSKKEQRDEENIENNNSTTETKTNWREIEKEPVSSGSKMTFNTHQCYVCFKLFETRSQLHKHCSEHFDICNEKQLKKCPLCNFATKNTDFSRHMRTMHEMKISYNYGKMNMNAEKTKFSYSGNEGLDVEVIPSIKNLNKKVSMAIDEKNRNNKDKIISKTKLVKIGKEWVVENERVKIDHYVVPKLVDSKNYFAKLKLLYTQQKGRGQPMLFPCQVCKKTCQTLSALILHSRKHDNNPKPYKKKSYQNRAKNDEFENNNSIKNCNEKLSPKHKPIHKCNDVFIDGKCVKIVVSDCMIAKNNIDIKSKIEGKQSNRYENPKPIKNKHRCDEQLIDFFEKNIRGGDVEFWQFLKIFNRMSKDKVETFAELESRHDFGIHVNDRSEQNVLEDNKTNNNDTDAAGVTNRNLIVNKSSRINLDVNNRANASILEKELRKEKVKNRNIRNKKRVLLLSKQEQKRRSDIKMRMRENILKGL